MCTYLFAYTVNSVIVSVMAASVPLLLFAEEDVEGGGKSIENDFAYKNNVQQSSIHIRMGN